jgi:hypothetical protein
MQAEERIRAGRIRFSTPMGRIWMWVVEKSRKRIGDTGTQRHMRPPGIVMGDP